MVSCCFKIRVDDVGASPTFFQISIPGLPFVDIGGLSTDLIGVNISIVLETVHGFYALMQFLEQLLYIPAVKEMAWYS